MTDIETQIVEACAAAGIPPPRGLAPGCRCETCQDAALAHLSPADRFRASSILIVCPDCGNKRCPHATHHDNKCTNSNLHGQTGSSYASTIPHT